MPTGIESITSSGWILSYSTANPNVFDFAEDTAVPVTPTSKNVDVYDLKLKHTCTHILNNVIYSIGSCPRCLGTAVYYDIAFTGDGDIVTVNKVDKIIQEVEKITLSSQNPFHPEYGMHLISRIGGATSELTNVIKQDLIRSIKALKEYQLRQSGFTAFSAEELINDIIQLNVTAVTARKLVYEVKITTKSAGEVILSGEIII